ncbi:hypothetical protein B0H14DRAFT_2592566 [Mycena olivaceomarginata]|nr:hypothetical protein B0H14DRAFT_2592566 [Mycena olivaceomarginata]
MPDVFLFLDHRYPEEAYHWVLLNKDRLKLYVMKRPITGELLEEAKGSKSKPAAEHAIRIGGFSMWYPRTIARFLQLCKYKIGFKTAVERMRLEGKPVSESEDEPIERKHKRPQKRTKSISSDEVSETAESSVEDELEDDAADEIADAATDDSDEDFPVSLSADSGSRLGKAEKDTYLFIGDKSNSDSEEISEIPRPQSVKRLRSPELEEISRKRMRRDSEPSSIISDDETASGSPHHSPRLRPVSSPFSYSYDPAVNTLSMPPVTSGTGSATDTTSLSTPPVTSRLGNYTPFSATVKAYVPPPPREGLHVPKSKRNIWE